MFHTHPLLPPLSPSLESGFQREHYTLRVRPTLRLVSPLLAALTLIHLALSAHAPAPYDQAVAYPQILLWLLVFGLTWVRGFERIWQPALVVLGWLTAALVLGRLAPLLADEVARQRGVGTEPPTLPQQKFYFMVQFTVFSVSLATLRLPSRWAVLLYGGVAAIGTGAFLRGLPLAPDLFLEVRFVLLPAALIVCVLLLVALTQEQLARRAFLANHQLEIANQQLEEERNNEKRKREQTEGKLHVLGQAIGGIVHDLGNPLANVQVGAQTLEIFLQDETPDKEVLQEFSAAISSGAQMLNYLRLSLIEQTRVLESKPIPIERKAVSLRHIIEEGARYQNPRFLHGREIGIVGADLQVDMDEMKMITVFMNLIGNALKYSDGEVCIACSTHEDQLLIAILDQGTSGRGISEAQAHKLFVAFERLDAHATVEGTGLGLLSVQKIVEAHGGEAFIEGYKDGTPASPRFSTAKNSYPPMLNEAYRTAFIVTCPLAIEKYGATNKKL